MQVRPSLREAFGSALRQSRHAKNLSQEALANATGLDRTFISLLERGLRQPTLATLFSLAECLDEKPSELVAKVESELADQT
ncbi:helix-turn-helix domain-containing protein [Lentisalinibacter sediminis]|uniref:helix-turn-helix domain-containing protein n=1 Tax=Lentisalinibacter sediminis TaxID=2992237 RepID=UPI003865580A